MAQLPEGSNVLYSKYIYEGEYRYLYVWYEQNGVRRTEKFLDTAPAPDRATASPKTKSVSNYPPREVNRPIAVPINKPAPKKVDKPVLKVKAPTAVGKFSFNMEEPAKKEITVPQPPPAPGPKPEYSIPEKKQTSVTKFEYLYGIKHLEIKHTQYSNKSVYVSKPISVSGNVMTVAMESIEEHPLFDELTGKAASRQTSVEYYIASVGTNPNPTLDDWHPILPESEKTVKSELLMFGTARTAELRFPALIGSTEIPKVYKNGLEMEDDEWSFIDGGFGVQLLVDKDPTGIYTINYTPNAEFYNPWSIDINQQGGRPTTHTQVFESGTNHNKTLVLEKYPYVDYEKINNTIGYDPNTSDYQPIKVTLEDAGIYGPNKTTYRRVEAYTGEDTQKVFTKNITNYKTGAESEPKKYSLDDENPYNGFDYYQKEDKLYFTETFNKADIITNDEDAHGNASIKVEYQYLSSDFRMKIILRRNSTDENTLTPIVHEYTLKFKVMK